MASVVGARGQVTLEKALRDELGIEPGWRVVQRRVGEHIELRFLAPRHRRSLRGVLADPAGPRFATDAELQQAIETAWGDEAAERHGLGRSQASSDPSQP